MLPIGSQTAALVGDHCDDVEQALVSAGYLAAPPVNAATTPFVGASGCTWSIPVNSSWYVISVRLRPEAGGNWTLTINPDRPVRPERVPSKPISKRELRFLAMKCYEIARTIHAAIVLSSVGARWAVVRAGGASVTGSEPVDPFP